eukprot:m.108515 g.108515  ORF g.108515 m.108515 type:complete len:2231 (-) comp13968_c0_seq1:73-6765(-)
MGDRNQLRSLEHAKRTDAIDKRFGFEKLEGNHSRTGWLMNIQTTAFEDKDTNQCKSAVDLYFLEENGRRFKICYPFNPYFLLRVKTGTESECESYLKRKFENKLLSCEQIMKEDLDLKNHLVGNKQLYLKLSFLNIQDLMAVRDKIRPAVNKNKAKSGPSVYDESAFQTAQGRIAAEDRARATRSVEDVQDFMVDLREYDVPYHMRVAIDEKINVSKWYNVKVSPYNVPILEASDKLDRPEPCVMAWDIETTKLPLKFPNPEVDQIMMISYMVDGQGYLINNREILSADVDDFEYTPKPDLEGPFEVFNVADEEALLKKFFAHIQELKPVIHVTYNGDFFDWPFLEKRCVHHELDLYQEIGFRIDNQNEYKCSYAPHMDAFRWVKRDSYLPVGSQGLKAVTKAKLRYDPIEVNYEDICRMAAEQPQELSNYSVSDSVATYYLYQKYVHPFIYALCTIIPLGPDDVLRKGSGTLCEALLMHSAFHANIVMPNKQQMVHDKMHSGHLIDTETYIGGHVEALEAGVFRNDVPMRFCVDKEAIDSLIDTMDTTLRYSIEEEEKVPFNTLTNYEEEKAKIVAQLEDLKTNNFRHEVPLIYHLDVAAMYPNIILTNRLQPMAMVDEADCAACDFNKPESKCQRVMDWAWRGDLLPASRGEYEMIKLQLESETFPGEEEGDEPRAFHQLDEGTRAGHIKKRLKLYSQKVYKKQKNTVVEDRKSTICQRENPFYIDTVRNFRDRRYVYKGKLKQAKKELAKVEAEGDPVKIKAAAGMVVLFDSLQLAHKCILNSFYGYVMRKGARWYSLEMAGIVCLTGANIITKAREIVERIGIPLELDTDGIWCCLPGTFPENVTFKTSSGKEVTVSYPGAMLNVMVKDHFTNAQYQTLIDNKTLEFEVSTVNSIFFEVDGPYKAMILPASKEKDKRLKKRYAVYDLDGSLAELKGFEIKRNGELKLVKVFQSGVFDSFLEGTNLKEIYDSVAKCANHWLDILYTRGENLSDQELIDLISENRSMSRLLSDYGDQKSTSISTAKRLAEFLGDDMVKDKGLACQFIISRKPDGAPVTERAIPVAIFQAEVSVRAHYLKRWLKLGRRDASLDIRDILDWDYYIERLGSNIQKIITIPAAIQKVANPVPRVQHPDWLQKRLLERKDPYKQKKINSIFKQQAKPTTAELVKEDSEAIPEGLEQMSLEDENNSNKANIGDLEDKYARPNPKPTMARVTKHKKTGKSKKARISNKSDIPDALPANWRQQLGKTPKRNTAEWLPWSKTKWRMQLQDRKRRRCLGISGLTRQAQGKGLGAFLAKQKMEIASRHWQVIQIVQTDDPGVMRVWAMVAGDLHSMKIDVYRKFYCNLRVDDPPPLSNYVRKINKALPRAHPCLHLYEFSLPEKEFQQRTKLFSSYFTHPDVEGVYETQVPLLWRAIVDMGCVTVVNQQAIRDRANGKSNGNFNLSDLDMKTVKECPYLEDGGGVEKIFLHHNSAGNRSLFGLFLPPTKTATLCVVDPGRNNQIPNGYIPRVWQESVEAVQSQQMTMPEKEYTFDVEVFQDELGAKRHLKDLLEQYVQQRHGPTVLIIQTPVHIASLSTQISSINEMPVVTAPVNTKDNNYPALDWQRYAVKRLLHQCATMEHWYSIQLQVSRYCNVPVGNLHHDRSVFVSDVMFSRALKKQNHLLWVSSSSRPDLGGREEDDNRLAVDSDESSFGLEINNPKYYDTVCVEFTVENLAVNAVLQSAHINDAEGADGLTVDNNVTNLDDMMGFQATLTSFDESASCMPVFRILKHMVHHWLYEALHLESEHADLQLMSFYRWLQSPRAELYDPVLCRMIRYMMKKLFLQLVGELQRLGATIVFASFSKIIISTQKTNCEDARKYVEYILTCIRAKPLFGTVSIEPGKYWEQLVWMDRSNYGALKEFEIPEEPTITHKPEKNVTKKKRKNNQITSDDEDEEEEMEVDDDGYKSPHEDDPVLPVVTHSTPEKHLEMVWNIAEYLPELCERQFNAIIGEWVLQNSEVMTKLCDKLMKIVPSIASQMPGDSAVDHSDDFPKRAGSHLKMNHPALEFVKMVCHVLALDTQSSLVVAKTRKNLLRLIKVRDFSEASCFHDPCLSLELCEVICSYCNHAHELDFCRDKNLTEGTWACEECGNSFDIHAIEQNLIEQVQTRSLAYQLQDLTCSKCHMVKQDNLSSYCSCSGDYNNTITLEMFMRRMNTLHAVASFHQLDRLSEEIEWVMQANESEISI